MDPLNQTKIVLTDKQLRLVRSIVRGTSLSEAIKLPWDQPRNPEDDKKGVMFWNVEKPIGSMHAAPEPKRRFMPSKHERNTVNKLVYAIKRGWIDMDAKRRERAQMDKIIKKEFNDEDFLENMGTLGDVWTHQEEEKKRLAPLVAPGFALPDHSDSFNPAPEFFENPNECRSLLLTLLLFDILNYLLVIMRSNLRWLTYRQTKEEHEKSRKRFRKTDP